MKLYTWTTPNGIKPLILLEELGVAYETEWVDIGHGQQHTPGFLRVNPNGKIPALEDGETIVFESGAILVYLAEKFGRFLPPSQSARASALSWLFFQVGSVGPMFGQLGHFLNTAEPQPYALERYRNETLRLYGVLDRRLREVEYLAGEYGVADIATVGWAQASERLRISLEPYPEVRRWLAAIAARPAVVRARALKPT